MNFYEKELRKLLNGVEALEDVRYTGRVAVGRVSDDVNAKVKFVPLETHSHCEAIEVSLINRREGKVDSVTLRFADIIGTVTVTSESGRDSKT